jgi:predicted transglutaminase-like cysteine proteinase
VRISGNFVVSVLKKKNTDTISTGARSVMYRIARILLLIAAVCCGCHYAVAHPSGTEPVPASEQSAGQSGQATQAILARAGLVTPIPSTSTSPQNTTGRDSNGLSEPFGLRAAVALPTDASNASAKWADIQSRLVNEHKTIERCRYGDDACPVGARRFLAIVEQGLQSHGRAQLGLINRAVNLSIRPVSDWSQHGVENFWSSPLETLSAGAGDCEDYAIVKYVALREAGIAPDDLRLVIVRDNKRQAAHAVVGVRREGQWLILDNRTLIMADAKELVYYQPLLVLDDRGVRAPATALLGLE